MRYTFLALAFVVNAAAFAADGAGRFAGTWKFNQAKSQVTGNTVVIEKTTDGMARFAAPGEEVKFRLDGKDYKHSLGYLMNFRETGERTWEVTSKNEEKVIGTMNMQLSSDNRTITSVFKGTKPTGEAFEHKTEMRRIGAGNGFYGTWQMVSLAQDAPDLMVFATDGPNGFSLSLPAWEFTLKAKFDGKDYVVSGPTIPAGTTASAKLIGPGVIEIVNKKDGKPVSTERLEVSADGKTLTDTQSFPGGKDKPMVWVYDRN